MAARHVPIIRRDSGRRNRAAYRRVDGQGSTTGSMSATDLDRQHVGNRPGAWGRS